MKSPCRKMKERTLLLIMSKALLSQKSEDVEVTPMRRLNQI